MALTQDSTKCCTDSIVDLSIGQNKKTGLSKSSCVDSGAESDREDGEWSIERQIACLNQADDTDGDHFNNVDGEDKNSKQSEGQRTEDDVSKNDSERNRQMDEEVCKNIKIRDSPGSIERQVIQSQPP
ncbi:uncharacterized protein LOC128552905 [Mercenaria mercenaria]|uniref:uncharacterized protein LOC128552905 n=1 Tax=Mercenaria mercenaria TaxID=6596 RepID=UPI00234F557D|nr:uncharacterized protein LOC128552905 [Mercenaria mercenaria]